MDISVDVVFTDVSMPGTFNGLASPSGCAANDRREGDPDLRSYQDR
jgi:hypothetical protein